MPNEPTREAREACGCWECVADGGHVLRDDCIRSTLDAFAAPLREKVERLEADAKTYAALIVDYITERDALRERVAELEGELAAAKATSYTNVLRVARKALGAEADA